MRLFIESRSGQLGDTLMQTPALRALRAANPHTEIVYVTEPRGLAHLSLLHNPNLDRFASRDEALLQRRSHEPWIELSADKAMTYGIAHRCTMYDGFAAQFGVTLDSTRVDLALSSEERQVGEDLLRSVGTPYKVVVCARHSTSDHSNLTPGAPPNKLIPNDVWYEVAEWLIELGSIPLAIGSAEDALDPRFKPWPGPRLYGQPLRTMMALVARARATFCVDTGFRFVAAATGCNLACVSGEVPIWLISCVPTQEGQSIAERQIPVDRVTSSLCKGLFWSVL